MAMDRKNLLERDLREAVREAEKVIFFSPSDFCRKTLKAISNFLTAWGELGEDVASNNENEGGDEEPEIPEDFVRICMCKVQRILGPGHDDLRDLVFSLLRSVEARNCRAMLLEFLPMALPRIDHKNRLASSSSSRCRKAKKELFACLRELLLDDKSLLSDGFKALSDMVEFYALSKKDVIQFVMGLLPKCPEENLHAAIRALIRNSDNDADARVVVDGIRTELSLVQETGVSDMFSVLIVFDESISDHRWLTFVEQYITRCEEISDCSNNPSWTDGDEHELKFSVFDLTFLLIAIGNAQHRERVEALFFASMAAQPGVLTEACPQFFFELVREENTSFDSPIVDRLVQAYLDVILVVFVSSCRMGDALQPQTNRAKSLNLVATAVTSAPLRFRQKMINKLTTMTQQVVKRSNAVHGSDETLLRQRICHGVLSVLLSIADGNPRTLTDARQHFIHMLRYEDIFPDDLKFIAFLSKLINILSESNQSSLATKNDLVLLCRALLVPHGAQRTSSTSDLGPVSSIIRGMVLAKEIVGRNDFDSQLCLCVGGLVSRIFKSPGGLDSRIGTEGVQLVHQLHLWGRTDVFDGKSVLDQVLAKLRLVRYLKDEKKAPGSRDVTVRFTETPDFLLGNANIVKRGKYLLMVFCFDSFLDSETSPLQTFAWHMSCKWIFMLLKVYLTIGRPKKWVPQAWTEAGIAFPDIPPNILKIYDKNQRLSRWFEAGFVDFHSDAFECISSCPLEKILDDIIQSKASSDRKALMEFSQRCALTLLLGISQSAAILNNVYAYFEMDLQGDDNHRRNEAVKLIQHQLVKIYSMRQLCQSLMGFFLAITKKRRKMGRGHSVKGSLHDEARSAAAQIQDTLEYFLSSTKSVPCDALWVALTDPRHDSTIISSLDPIANNQNGKKNSIGILQMKLNVINHLCCLITHSMHRSANEDDWKVNDALRQRVARCLRMALFISRHLLGLKQANRNSLELQPFANVSTGFLRLCRRLLLFCSANERNRAASASDKNFGFFVDLYCSLLGSQDPMYDAIDIRGSERVVSAEDFKNLAQSCREHLQICSTAVATELMDTLSVFAIFVSKTDSKAIQFMIELSWESMKFQFNSDSSTSSLTEIPFALTELLNYISLDLGQVDTENINLVREVISKIIPLDTTSEAEYHNYMVHAMCRHWSLLSMSPKKAAFVIEHLTQFFEVLKDFLEDNDKPHEITVPVSLEVLCPAAISDFGVPASEPASQGLTQAQATREISSSATFPCLSLESCSLYFDTLLKLLIASIAIFSVNEEIAFSRSTAWGVHPFDLLGHHFELFGALVSFLFSDSAERLAGTVSPSLLQSLKMLLDIAAEQIHQCIDWCLTEPPLSQEDTAVGRYDPAAKPILKDLVECYRIEVVGALEQLCIKMFSDQRMPALQRKLEKACDYVRHISTEFELGEIKTSYSEDSDTDAEPRAKRRKTHVSQAPFDASTLEESVKRTQDLRNNDEAKNQGKILKVDGPEESASDYSEEQESIVFQNDESSSSGAFGVNGNWGQDEGENHSNDDSSRQLGEVTVTH